MTAPLHSWSVTPKQAVQLQRELAGLVVEAPLAGPVATVAGADCAFSPDKSQILAAAVLLDAGTLEVLDVSEVVQPVAFPYVSGLLSFREAPAVIAAVRGLSHGPDLLMCDGQGRAHPRRIGLASHVGLWLDLPTIGVAKSRLCGEHRSLAARRGSAVQLVHDGEVIGKVVRTRDAVRPVYVSVGHRVTLDEAVRWTLRTGRGVRIPEPTRRADRHVAEMKRRLW